MALAVVARAACPQPGGKDKRCLFVRGGRVARPSAVCLSVEDGWHGQAPCACPWRPGGTDKRRVLVRGGRVARTSVVCLSVGTRAPTNRRSRSMSRPTRAPPPPPPPSRRFPGPFRQAPSHLLFRRHVMFVIMLTGLPMLPVAARSCPILPDTARFCPPVSRPTRPWTGLRRATRARRAGQAHRVPIPESGIFPACPRLDFTVFRSHVHPVSRSHGHANALPFGSRLNGLTGADHSRRPSV